MEEIAVELEVGFEGGVVFGGGGEEGDSVGCSVEVVADDGVAEGLHVDADLMGAAGLDADLDEGEGAVGGGEALEDVDVGDGGADAFAAEGSAGGHAGATDEVTGDGEVDGGVIFCNVAVDEGEIGFGDLAGGEHLAELAVGTVVFGDEDEAAGLLVEAVDDAGAEVSADLGELGEVVEEGVDEGAAVAGVFVVDCGGAGSGVDHHAGGLVDDGKVLVFEEDVEGDVFGEGVEGRGAGGAFDLDGLAAEEFLLGLGGVAVDADLAGFDEELDASAGDVGDGLGEVLVEAEVGRGGVGGEGADLGSTVVGFRIGFVF